MGVSNIVDDKLVFQVDEVEGNNDEVGVLTTVEVDIVGEVEEAKLVAKFEVLVLVRSKLVVTEVDRVVLMEFEVVSVDVEIVG